MPTEIPLRALGRTGVDVTAIGVGGYHLGLMKDDNEAVRLVHEAIDAGITFLDNAWEYHEGRSEELMGRSVRDRRDEVFLMTKVCTHGRDRHVAMRQLEGSLRRVHRPQKSGDALEDAVLRLSLRRLPTAVELLRRDFPQLRAAGVAGTRAAGDCGHWNEEPGWGREYGEGRGSHRRRGAALCDEPAGRHCGQRHGVARRPATEPECCARLHADER